mmetsp:Transcript_48550/g.115400  ORF Transcript_48550/g.115400 Transcript_48550/m.115400 type:complete len:208 (-) Transcript_48550:67-690(-)
MCSVMRDRHAVLYNSPIIGWTYANGRHLPGLRPRLFRHCRRVKWASQRLRLALASRIWRSVALRSSPACSLEAAWSFRTAACALKTSFCCCPMSSSARLWSSCREAYWKGLRCFCTLRSVASTHCWNWIEDGKSLRGCSLWRHRWRVVRGRRDPGAGLRPQGGARHCLADAITNLSGSFGKGREDWVGLGDRHGSGGGQPAALSMNT